MADEERTGDDTDAARRTLEQVRQIWVAPELERRRLDAQSQLPAELTAFQVIWMGGGGQPPTVRVNDEIRVLLKVDVPVREGLTVGAPISLDSTAKVEAVHVHPEEEKYAHFTAVRIDRRWFYSFDFRYQRDDARRHLEVAEQFLAAARHAHNAGLDRAFLENAHSVVELVVKIDLLLMSQISTGRIQHPELRQRASRFLHLQDAHALLERLAQLRLPSRYLVGNLEVVTEELDQIAAALDALLERARAQTVALGPAA